MRQKLELIILVHSLKKESQELRPTVNLCQTRLSQLLESYVTQFQEKAQVNQDIEMLLVGSKKQS